MRYGLTFFCLNKDGSKSEHILFPKIQAFFYEDGEEYWLLLEDFGIEWKYKDKWYRITIKAGFEWDGASIPMLFRSIIGDKLQHHLIVAALFHDGFYSSHNTLISRDIADFFFYDIPQYYRATQIKRNAIWSAVRVGGFFCWNKNINEIDHWKEYVIITEL